MVLWCSAVQLCHEPLKWHYILLILCSRIWQIFFCFLLIAILQRQTSLSSVVLHSSLSLSHNTLPFPSWPRNCSCDFSHYKIKVAALPWVFYRWTSKGSNPNSPLDGRDSSKPCSWVCLFVITDRVKTAVCALHKNCFSLCFLHLHFNLLFYHIQFGSHPFCIFKPPFLLLQ